MCVCGCVVPMWCVGVVCGGMCHVGRWSLLIFLFWRSRVYVMHRKWAVAACDFHVFVVCCYLTSWSRVAWRLHREIGEGEGEVPGCPGGVISCPGVSGIQESNQHISRSSKSVIGFGGAFWIQRMYLLFDHHRCIASLVGLPMDTNSNHTKRCKHCD
ncbi:hypothetical protein F4679DRAFT_396117 [Xylaria curta]|nr:hypothetical protein F4679DRAFT_396117 [Xylaria curta]